LPATIELSLGRNLGFLWEDPFNPAELARLRAAVRLAVRPWRGSAYRIGYFFDNEVGWWNGPLFTVYSGYPPENHSKRRLVTMLRDHYNENWSDLLHDFVPPEHVDSFDGLVNSRAPLRMRPGGAGIGFVRRWAAEIADQYYRTIAEEIRAADPGALIFGDRLPIYYDQDAVRAMAPYVDAIAVNYNVDGADGWIARYFFEGLRQLTAGKPVLITEWFFAAQRCEPSTVQHQHESHWSPDDSCNASRAGGRSGGRGSSYGGGAEHRWPALVSIL
jgi:uncharacterized membrane protein YgcG